MDYLTFLVIILIVANVAVIFLTHTWVNRLLDNSLFIYII